MREQLQEEAWQLYKKIARIWYGMPFDKYITPEGDKVFRIKQKAYRRIARRYGFND
jgi:hypothetical protein